MRSSTLTFLFVVFAAITWASCQVVNFREVGGVRYATLDDAAPTGAEAGSQVDPLNLPQGWAIAPSNSATMAAATSYGWSTDCLVLADGSMVSTNPSVPCNEGQLVVASGAFRPKQKRILISQQAGGISNVTPASGPLGGGNEITISGSLGNGQDITQVTVAGTIATIKSQTPTEVVVIAGISRNPVTGNVVIVSTSMGTLSAANAYTYLAGGNIQSVIPSSGPIAGGNTVTINGVNLGNNDITSVTINAVAATIVSQSATRVVVTVPAAASAGLVAVAITSTANGANTLANGYTYNSLPSITSIVPASGAPAGGNPVTITGDLGNNDITSVLLNGVQALIRSQTASEIVVTAQPGSGSGPVTITSTSRGTATSATPYAYVAPGAVQTVTPNAGTRLGGTLVTISGTGLGSGSDISAVRIGGVPCVIQSQTATSVVVVTAEVPTPGPADVVVVSASVGTATSVGGFTFFAVGEVKSVTPNGGPVNGGTTVTIDGTELGSGTDITEVSLAGVAATIVSQTATRIVVTTGAGQALLGNVVVKSTSRGTSSLASGFTYFSTGTIRTVVPAAAAVAGGSPITITGESLGSGNDITYVALVDVPATIISQTANEVVVMPARSGAASGSVVIRSGSRGEIILPNSFSYTQDGSAPFAVPSSGPVAGGSTVTITSAAAPLGSGTDITSVTLNGVAATISSQTTTSVVVVTGAGTAGTGAVVVTSTSVGVTSVPNSYLYMAPGAITAVNPATGPLAGRNTITITGTDLGSGSDITAVRIGTVAATIQSQTATQVVVVVGAGAAGTFDVTVVSASRGAAVKAAAYFYDSAMVSFNYFVYNGKQYATIDNAVPTDQILTGCQDTFKPIPEGWTLAADNVETRTAVFGPKHKFGTTCLVLASGVGVNSVTGAQCGTNMLIQIGANYGAGGCPSRILITRAALSGETDNFKTMNPITNYIVYNNFAWATIENVAPTTQVQGCSNTALELPAGWALAPQNADSIAVSTQYVWGASCLVMANGWSAAHNGAQCGTAQLLKYDKYYAVQNCESRILVRANLPVPLPPLQPRSIELKMLLVSTSGDPTGEIQLGVAKRNCDMVGMKYDSWAAAPTVSAAAGTMSGDLSNILAKSDTLGNYYGIIVSQNLVFINYPDVKTKLVDYARKFNLNILVLYTFPGPTIGVSLNSTAVAGATPTNIQISAAARNTTMVAGLVNTAKVPMAAIFHYPAIIVDPSVAKPVLDFVTNNGDIEGVAAIEYNPQDGHKEMHMFFDQAAWDLPSAVYSHLWLNWVTRGLYTGARRIHLAPQIDDLFLSTGTWVPATNTPAGPAYRATAGELQDLANFASETNALMPAGSSIRFEFALNGFGVGNGQGVVSGDSLFTRALQLIPNFNWVSHGYTHLNFTQNGAPPHDTTYEEAYVEVLRNYQFMMANMFTTPERLNSFSNHSMVTPAISGLHNGEVLRALKDNYIVNIVGDNSRLDLTPEFPYRCIHSNTTFHGQDGLLIIPRYATSVYYDVKNPQENVAEYNHLYSGLNGRNLTMQEIMTMESVRTTHNLLVLRQDPYMFHQANLHVFDFPDPVTGQEKEFSLLSLWMRYVTSFLTKFTNLPILNHKQDTMAQKCLEREARDLCAAKVMANVDATNKVTSLTFSGGNGCTLSVTGAEINQAGVTMETYGPDKTAWVPVPTTGELKLDLVQPIVM